MKPRVYIKSGGSRPRSLENSHPAGRSITAVAEVSPCTSRARAGRAACSSGSGADVGLHVESQPSGVVGVEPIERPAAVLVAPLLHQVRRLGDPRVGIDAGAAQVVEPAQHVVVPDDRKREARPAGIDHLAGGQRPQHAALEQVVVPPRPRLRHGGLGALRLFVCEQPFEDADRGVERGSRAGRSLAVPAAILELLPEQAVEQPIALRAKVGTRRQDPAVDAGFGLAVEKGPTVELEPGDALAHEADRSADFLVRWIRTHFLQQCEGVIGGHPAVLLVVVPVAVGCLTREKLGAPTLGGDARPLGRNRLCWLIA